MAVSSEATAPNCYDHTFALCLCMYVCMYFVAWYNSNPMSASAPNPLRFAVPLRIPKPMIP